MTCTFYGHCSVGTNVMPIIEEIVIDLIENHGVDKFYIGNTGKFDTLCEDMICRLFAYYPHIEAFTVLTHDPKCVHADGRRRLPAIYPKQLNHIPRKSIRRIYTEWMLEKADFVINYVTVWTDNGISETVERLKKGEKSVIYPINPTYNKTDI